MTVNELAKLIDATLLNAGKDKWHGSILGHGVVFEAQKHAELATVVSTIGREVVELRIEDREMRVFNKFFEVGEAAAIFDTHAGSQLFDAGKRTCPNDIVYVVVVGKEVVLARVAVEHTNKVFALKAEEVEEGAVLTEPIGVVGVVAGGFVVALNDNNAVTYIFAQLFTTSDISFFFEHGIYFKKFQCLKGLKDKKGYAIMGLLPFNT